MRAPVAGLALVAACSTAACSVLLDWSDFSGGTGGTGDASGLVDSSTGDATSGADGSGGPDGATGDGAPGTCASTCESAPPAGWAGPLALSVTAASQGAAPACGAGFDATPAFDGFADLTAPAPTCSACACGASSGVTCTGPTMSFFVDTACMTPAGGSLTVSSSCVTTPFEAQSVMLTGPSATGGTCPSTGGALTSSAPSWGQVARACAPSSLPSGDGCDAGQVCAPAPAAPYSTRPCVMQAGTATSCPAGYPGGPQVFYAGVDDGRGCSTCVCTGPTGAQCTAPAPAVDIAVDPSCSVPMGTLDAPSACVAFQGLEFVTLAGTPTVSSAGTCALVGGGDPMGNAIPSGATSFCCQL
jgi:hypothetical protein